MTTHYVNQELAKHRYATLMREAHNHRLVRREQTPEPEQSRLRQQLTWARQRLHVGSATQPT